MSDYKLYLDDENYICFDDKNGLDRPGIAWTVHHGGWKALVDGGEYEVLHETGTVVFPTEEEIKEARTAYAEWLERNKDSDGK